VRQGQCAANSHRWRPAPSDWLSKV